MHGHSGLSIGLSVSVVHEIYCLPGQFVLQPAMRPSIHDPFITNASSLHSACYTYLLAFLLACLHALID
jgi:hypothetical protein